MKTINFTKFPLLDRDGKVTETSMVSEIPEYDFFNIAFKNSGNREEVMFNMTFDKYKDIELTEENIEYFKRHLAIIQPATYLYSFEEYIKDINHEDSQE